MDPLNYLLTQDSESDNPDDNTGGDLVLLAR